MRAEHETWLDRYVIAVVDRMTGREMLDLLVDLSVQAGPFTHIANLDQTKTAAP